MHIAFGYVKRSTKDVWFQNGFFIMDVSKLLLCVILCHCVDFCTALLRIATLSKLGIFYFGCIMEIIRVTSGIIKILSRWSISWNRPHDLRAVERSVVLEALARELPEGTIRFNSRVSGIKKTESKTGITTVELQDGSTYSAKVSQTASSQKFHLIPWLQSWRTIFGESRSDCN